MSKTSLLRLTLPASKEELTAHLTPGPLVRLDRKGWQATAGANASKIAQAFDADPSTRWDTAAAQIPGQWFALDLGSPRAFSAVALDAGSGDDYPRGYELYLSEDGRNWGKPVAAGDGARGKTLVQFPRATARYLRVAQTKQAGNFWSIYDLDVYDARPPAADDNASKLPRPAVLVAAGLQDPQGLALDAGGNVYVSDWGDSHQVKVFDAGGKLLRSIGDGSRPAVGPYNPNHMNHPNGLTLDGHGRLWVAETDKSPKRLSVWSPDGKLLNALYGPPQYGGGGWLDPMDKTRFFYADEGGMELKLDWQTGRSKPTSVYYRPELDPLRSGAPGHFNAGHAPETPIHLGGRDYLTDCYNTSPTNGSPSAALWLLKDGAARRAAAMGQAREWPALNFAARFSVRWTGQIVPAYSETYTISASADGGVRVTLDGRTLFDQLSPREQKEHTGTIDLKAGRKYDLRVEYAKTGSNAAAKLYWSSPSQPKQIVPPAVLSHLNSDAAPASTPPASAAGLSAEYFANPDFTDPVEPRVDPSINFDLHGGPKGWPLPRSPVAGLAERLPPARTSPRPDAVRVDGPERRRSDAGR